MPILFVNGKRRGLRIRGRATVTAVRRRKRHAMFAAAARGKVKRVRRALDADLKKRYPLAASNPARRKSRRAFPYIGLPARPKAKSTYRKRVWLTPYKKGVPMPFLAAYRAKKKNPARKRRRGRMPAGLARYWAKHGTRTRRRHRMPKGLRDYWAKHRKNPARRRAGNAHPRAIKKRRQAALKGWRHRKNRRSPSRRHAMAKGSRKRSKAMKRVWAARRRAGKLGPLGRTKRRRARRTGGKHRRRARKSVHRRRRSSHRRRRRTIHTMVHGVRVTRRSRRRRKGRRATKRMSSRRMHMMLGPEAATVRMNPGRRRHKRRRSRGRGYAIRKAWRGIARRRRRGRSTRRSHRRRSYRRYRRNPGIGDIFSGIKRVIPLALSFLGNRMAVNKLGPMLPVVSSLGSLQGPVLSLGSMLLTEFLTKKVGALAKYREEAVMGARFQLLASLWTAFAPASIQSAVGEYVNMGDYVAVGAAPPLNERFTLSDYVAVGGDGVEEELGMGAMEELGVEEELGNVLMGGLPGPVSGSMGMLKQVPAQQFISPIPARSFTKQIPAVTTAYDNSADLYSGIFGGKFGGGG